MEIDRLEMTETTLRNRRRLLEMQIEREDLRQEAKPDALTDQ